MPWSKHACMSCSRVRSKWNNMEIRFLLLQPAEREQTPDFWFAAGIHSRAAARTRSGDVKVAPGLRMSSKSECNTYISPSADSDHCCQLIQGQMASFPQHPLEKKVFIVKVLRCKELIFFFCLTWFQTKFYVVSIKQFIRNLNTIRGLFALFSNSAL